MTFLEASECGLPLEDITRPSMGKACASNEGGKIRKYSCSALGPQNRATSLPIVCDPCHFSHVGKCLCWQRISIQTDFEQIDKSRLVDGHRIWNVPCNFRLSSEQRVLMSMTLFRISLSV